jgi:predicted transcriptional regulator
MLHGMKYEEAKNMKQKNVYMLDNDDGKAIQLFVKLGMPKNLAKTLLYVSQFDECKCADVEQGTDMRQPEVSIAMQELRRRGWVKKRDLKKKGKGRPVHIYKPTTHLSEILNAFEQEKLKEVESVKNDISILKNIIQNR